MVKPRFRIRVAYVYNNLYQETRAIEVMAATLDALSNISRTFASFILFPVLLPNGNTL